MNVNTWRIVSTIVWTLQVKNHHNVLMLLSKIAEIHVWNKLKLYTMVPISTQIFPMIKSDEQLLNDSQCNG